MNRFLPALLGLLCLLSPVFAQQAQPQYITVNVQDLSPEQIAAIKAKQSLRDYGQYVGMGKEIGEAMNAALTSLTDSVNKVADSKAGHFTMAMIAFKVVGWPAAHILIGLSLYLMVFLLSLLFYVTNVRKHTFLVSVGPDKTKKYQETEGTAEQQGLWALATAIGIVIASIVTFANR